MIVCHCHGVSDRRIESEMLLGATSVEDIGERCGAGTNCGGCIPLIENILESKLVALMNQSTVAAVEVESSVRIGSVTARRGRDRTLSTASRS
ncbi:MAG: (2Fe-2S)-binding protein [Microthrixaceae bacterium]